MGHLAALSALAFAAPILEHRVQEQVFDSQDAVSDDQHAVLSAPDAIPDDVGEHFQEALQDLLLVILDAIPEDEMERFTAEDVVESGHPGQRRVQDLMSAADKKALPAWFWKKFMDTLLRAGRSRGCC